MKLNLLFILLFTGSIGLAQGNKLYTLSGIIEEISHYTGGIERPYFLDNPKAKPNYTMIVVRLISPDEPPVRVGSIRSDSLGHFSVVLPAGKYGFVLASELDSLRPGQTLPVGSQMQTAHEYSSDGWSLNFGSMSSLVEPGEPMRFVSISGKDVCNVHILHSISSGCLDCP